MQNVLNKVEEVAVVVGGFPKIYLNFEWKSILKMISSKEDAVIKLKRLELQMNTVFITFELTLKSF